MEKLIRLLLDIIDTECAKPDSEADMELVNAAQKLLETLMKPIEKDQP